MNDLETMQRAKMYIDKMANGIDPISGQQIAEDDCLNQVRVSRCLFYVSDILRKLIDNGGEISKKAKSKKAPFSITPDDLKNYVFDKKPITVSEITTKINSLVSTDSMVKLKHTSIVYFLCQTGMLTEIQLNNGKKVKKPTPQGEAIGISLEERTGYSGVYHVVVYNTDAQRFILDNIDSIAQLNSPAVESADLQWQPWTKEHTDVLIDLFNQGVSISEIAVTLKRTQSAVRARLKILGLLQRKSES